MAGLIGLSGLSGLAAGWLTAAGPVSAAPAAGPAPAADVRSLFAPGARPFERTSAQVVGVYVPQWEPAALLDAVPADNVTHLIYAFLHLCGPGQLPVDAAKCEGRHDFELASSEVDARFDKAFAAFKQRGPHVKVLASVGGWGGSDPFFHLANDPARRRVFAASVAQFLREHPAFDGIDIDWEHPTSNGSANGVALGSPADGQGYGELLLALRAAVDRLTAETGRPYLVTSAVNAEPVQVAKVDYRRAAPALDLLFMMSYDYYGGWSKTAGHHTGVRASGPGRGDGLAASVDALLAAGMPAAKLVAGVAFYGRGFTGVAGPAADGGFNGVAKTGGFPGSDGSAPWKVIARDHLDAQGRARGAWQARQDPQTGGWALFNARDGLYLGYDDPRAILDKGALARQRGLAGLFAWELSQDDGRLLNAMNRAVGNLPRR